MNTLGKNRTFPIYKSDGTSFHDLVLHKSTCESVVMSLGDKITGDVYYKDNTLAVTMQEYIKFKVNPDDDNEDEVKYVLVNPPTVIREGMASDNSELKGMTKYSFTFYHPMYMLGNLPFTDIAVLPDQEKYLSQNKTFTWMGNGNDLIAKLNKNLEGTQWVVVSSGDASTNAILSKFPSQVQAKKTEGEKSDVLSFDKNFISDVLKVFYDNWGIPFVIDSLKPNEYFDDNNVDYYSLEGGSKRFVIVFGNPTNTILDDNDNEFVFRFGQGVGLKNNSRTQKNNKIITRIAGYGSENNIPYGYPQIIWYGNQTWDYTINNDSTNPNSFPIYRGIVNGQYVKLIKHPFTRKNLMPTVYVESVFNKVSPYAVRTLPSGAITANPNYDPTLEIVDYYDAVDDANIQYPNQIVPSSPSFEIHQFENIKPQLGDKNVIAISAYDEKEKDSISVQAFTAFMNGEIAAATADNDGITARYLTEMLSAFNVTPHTNAQRGYTGGSYTYEWILKFDGNYCEAFYNSPVTTFTKVIKVGNQAVVWDDSIDDDGNYKQSYFKMTIQQLEFDLYACASITESMQINMRSGACIGCTFDVQVDWDDYKKNFYDANGDFAPTGSQRDYTKYPDSRQGQITLVVAKDTDTFGTILPDSYRTVAANDTFVILGISLPQSYVTAAQVRLDEAMKEYMLENNVYYYEYPLKFDEHFLATHNNILAQIRNNVGLKFIYGNEPAKRLFVKQMTIKYGDAPLPTYDIVLTDDIEIVLNSVGQVTDDVSRMRVQMSELQKYYGINIENVINEKLSRVEDDIAKGRITFQQGLDAIGRVIFSDEIKSNGFVQGMTDQGRGWRIDAQGNAEFESLRCRSYLEVIELLINRLQAQEGDTLYTDNDQITFVEEKTYNNTTYYKLTLKEKWDGYVTCQKVGNIIKGIINTLAAQAGNVSDVTTQQSVESDGNNKYFTSWMRVINPTDVGDTVSNNQICVVLYSDSDTPANKNFEPCELMNIARWGCLNVEEIYGGNPTPAQIADVERRQRLFSISTSDGRITKMRGVNHPKISAANYGTTLGVVPDFINQWSIASRLLPNRDYLYAQGVIVGDFIKVNAIGEPITNYVDKGEWQNNTEYLCNEYNEYTLQYETHDVWHNNAKWRCLQHQPVTVGGVTTYYEPSDANSLYWLKLEEGAKGDSPVYVYSNNENDNVGLTYNGMVDGNQTITSNVYVSRGSDAIQSFQVHVYDGTESSANEYSAGVEKNGVTVSRRVGVGVVGFSMLFRNEYDFSQISKKVFLVKIIVGSDVRYVRINVNLVKAAKDGDHAVLWKVVPNYTEVVKKKDGSYVPSQSISCLVVKSVGGQTSYPSSGFTLQKSLNGGEWTTITTSDTTNPSDITTNLRYRVLVNQIEMDLQTVSLVSDGEDGTSPYFADLDNEMDSVPCTNAGVTTSAYDQIINVGLWHGSNTMSISSMSYKVNNGTTYSDSRTIDGITVTPSSVNKTIRIQVANSTTLAEHNDIEIIVAGSGSGNIELHFTLNGVRAGSNGENAVLQELQPDLSAISFARTVEGGLTPTARDLVFVIKKTVGSTVELVNILLSGLTVRWSITGTPSSPSDGNAWNSGTETGIFFVAGVMRVTNAVTATNIYVAAFNSDGLLIDRETIPVIKDGNNGNDGNTIRNISVYKDSETKPDAPIATSVADDATTVANGWLVSPPSIVESYNIDNTGLNTDIGTMTPWAFMTPNDPNYSTFGDGWKIAKGNKNNSSNSKFVVDRVYFTPQTDLDFLKIEIAASAEMGYDGVFVGSLNTPATIADSRWNDPSYSTKSNTANNIVSIALEVSNQKNNNCFVDIVFRKDGSAHYNDDCGYYRIVNQANIWISVATLKNTVVQGSWSEPTRWNEKGEQGKAGRSYYYAGDWDSFTSSSSWIVSNAQAPFFSYTPSGGTKGYYVFNPKQNGTYTKSAIVSSYGNPSNEEPWEIMVNDFKYLITEAVFGDYAHFGANIINADYRYSQYGFMRGLGEIKANISDSSQYKNIDPNDPFGTEEFMDDSRKIRNENLSGYAMVSPNTYTIIGSLIEFSTSSSVSYGHSVYQNGDSYFRYKTKSAAQWGSWIAFGSGSYSFAISNNKNDTSSSTSGFSWQTYPPVPTDSQPYLWLKTGSSSCMRVSSKVANFTLEKDEWYTIEIDAEYVGSENMDIMVGNGSRKQTITTNQKRYGLLDNDTILACYAIFKYTGDTITDANVWSQFDGYVEFEAVYHAQFVPYLCEDLKSGKFVVNDIVARGQLHGDSLYFKHSIAFHRVYVHDESILSIPHAHDNEITTIVLPSPTESNGRVIEVYSGLEDGQNWSPTWDGASSGDYFRSFVCNTGGVDAGGTWDATYVKFWSNGSYWYVLKAERAIYDSDNDRHLIQLISKTH